MSISIFFKQWEELLTSQVKPVMSLFITELEDWSKKERPVEVYENENDLGIKKLEVVKDEQD